MKLYFETELERDAYNAAEAMFRGCNMDSTRFWYQSGEDEDGYFLIIND